MKLYKHEYHGKKKTRLYRIWSNVKTRCYNVNDPHYKRWGGKGVKMCEDWKTSFLSFYNWAMANGYTDELTIDRINFNGNYEPSNCRWVTIAEQNRNKSDTILITYNGETKTAAQWAHDLNLGHDTVRQRYHKGWTPEQCLFGKRG